MQKLYTAFPVTGRLSILFLFTILCLAGFSQSTTLISPTGDGGFENGTTFAANGWTVVNGATNQWFVGAGSTPTAGARAAYIDNGTGATNTYTNTSSSIVYFYRDVTFPAGQTDINLSFKWKANGESTWDWLVVWSAPTSVTPVVNSPAAASSGWNNLASTYPGATLHGTQPYNLVTTTQTATICLPSSYAGTTRRLIFMWQNDGSGGTAPAASVDEISLVTTTPAPPAAQPTGLSLTPVSTSQINGSFTAATGAPSYLVVAYPAGSTPVSPVNGSSYSLGAPIGNGTVVYNGTATTFNATGLSGTTSYDFYVYSYTSLSCAGNQYLATGPLTGNASTTACTGLAGGTYSVGPTGTYPTLTAAVAATAGGIAGPVIFELQSTYTSGSETFPITFAHNSCVGPVNSIIVRPATGAAGLAISGDNATAIIDLNGADYVTIDGRPGGTGTAQQLSVINTNTTGVAIRLQGDARNNTLTYLDLQGSSNVTPTTQTLAGVVYIAGAGTDANGNDNNTISNCKIHSSSGGSAAVGIYAFGSTTTVASYNDNITITNCEIYDFFKATAASTGIKIDAGNNAWTISNNHFYQTQTLTYTTAATHRALWVTPNTASINNTASGFVITGNYIGGSTVNAGGTAYTMAGAIANIFNGMDLSTGLGTATSVQNNVIANIALTTTSTGNAFIGIGTANGNNNIGTVTGNTIGSMTGTGNIIITSTGSAGTMFGIRIGGGNINNISNNKIGGIDVLSSGTVSRNFIGIGTGGGTTTNVTNNRVGGDDANSIRVSASNSATVQSVTGINIVNGTTTSVSGNTVQNLTNEYTGTGAGLMRGVVVTTSASSITNNIIRNLYTTSPTAGSGASSAISGIIMSSTNTAGCNVIGNTIDSLVLGSTSATAAQQITGLFYSGATTVNNTISKNFIHSFDLVTANPNLTFTAIDNAAGTNTLANNIIRLGIKPDGTDLSNDNIIRGISSNSTSATNIYHNSIYIGGQNVGSTVKNSFAIIRTATSGTYDIRNNILVNNRSNASAGSGGKHYTIYFTTATTGATVNYNVYQYTGNDGNFAYNGTADVPAFTAGWLSSDGNSIVGNPQFIDALGSVSTLNLHIHPTNPTPIEGAGIAIAAVTDDYDGQTRSGLTPTDIGADAGNFALLDLSPPSIIFTPLGGACNTNNRTLTATITDNGTVVTGANGPRIYYRKNSGAWVSAAGVNTSGSSWDFTLAGAAVGGFSNLDVIDYFVTAQDNAGNIGSNPGGAAGTNVQNITTYPATPASYNIALLTGSYNVGSSEPAPFNTLTAAANLYNNACLTSAVTFNLTDPTYDGTTEIFPIVFNANPTASATNSLTIKPSSGNTVIITGSVASNSLIRFNAAKYITIDGSNSGTNTQDITITNTNTTTPSVISVISNGVATGSSFITIKNNNINTTALNHSGYGISVGGATPGSAAADNDNITIDNNNITVVGAPVYAVGLATGLLDNLVISGNTISVTTTITGIAGIRVGQATGASVRTNTLSIETTGATAPVGISLETGTVSSVVTRNLITKVLTTATNGYGGRGITVGTGNAASNITISNNMIYGVNGSNWTGFTNSSSMGIVIGEVGSGTSLTTLTGGINIYHNSVNLYGNSSFAGATLTAALYVGSAASALDVRNNIFSNSIVNTNATNAGSKSFAIYSAAANTAFATINYNNYYVSGTHAMLANIGGTDRSTLAAVVTGFGQNANSFNVDPQFTANNDLHLQSSSTMDASGTPVGVTVDFDNEVRDITTPDIGADELPAPVGIDIKPVALVSPVTVTSGCYNVETITVSVKNNSQTVHNFVANPVSLAVSVTTPSTGTVVYTRTISTGTMAAGEVQNFTTTTPGATINMSTDAGLYSFEISTNVTVGVDVNTANNTITETRTKVALSAGTPASSPASYCVTGGAPTLSSAGAAGYTSLQWQQSTTSGSGYSNIAGGTTLPYTIGSAITQSMYYQLKATCGTTTVTSAELNVAINNPQITGTTPASRCGTGTVNLGATGGPGTTLNWYTASTGGLPIGTGTTFTTPTISSTTTYYVGAATGVANTPVGGALTSWNSVSTTGSFQTTLITGAAQVFDVLQPLTISTMDMYPSATVGTAFTIEVRAGSATGTLVGTYSGVTTVTNSGTPANVQTVPVNFTIGTPGTYYIGFATTNPNTWRSQYNTPYPYPVTLPGYISITGSSLGGLYCYYLYNFVISTGCESPRTPVVATVSAPPAVSITAGKTICNNAIHQLQVTSTLADFDSYVWSPTTGLFTDASATVAYTGTSASTVYVKNSTAGATTYTLTATNTGTGCANTATSVVTVMPDPSINATPAEICISGTTALSLSPSTGYGAGTLQWQTSPNGTNYTNIAAATNATYTTPTLTSTTYYKVILKDGAGATCSQEPAKTVTVNNPQITGTTPGARCGTGTVTLGANANGGSVINWYAAASGGSALGTGNSFTTPSISATTTYYASASNGGGTQYVGPLTPASLGTPSSSTIVIGTQGTFFDVTASTVTIGSVDIFPTATVGSSFTIVIQNSSGTQIFTTPTLTTTVTGGALQTVPLNAVIPAGTQYKIGFGVNPGMNRATTGAVYPYTLPGIISITGNTFDPAYYYFTYNWQIITGCESGRTAVVATVNNPASNAAGAAGTTECATATISGSTPFNFTDCDPIAIVNPSGALPVSGSVTSCVTIDNSVQAANSQYYVARHYDITPATNANTSTATVTLYFLQSEFNAYNAAINTAVYPALPTGPADATGISKLRVTHFHGTGTNPTNYTGAGELIDPSDANIVWNATSSRWEVTFNITGQGGLYVHTGNFVLPVTGLELKGEQSGASNKLTWNTLTEINNKGFELQRSADGKNFSSIASVATKADNGNSTSPLSYAYVDAKPIAGNNYYRLKQIDRDGKFTYSNVVVLGRKATEIMLSSVYPNPAARDINVVITSPKAEKVTLVVTDLSGKVLMQRPVQVMTGENIQKLEVMQLAAGTYLVKAICDNGCETAMHRFVKQ